MAADAPNPDDLVRMTDEEKNVIVPNSAGERQPSTPSLRTG
jgi:hypothetical protein